MKKVLPVTVLALLLVTSMGFVVVGNLFQDKEDEESAAYLGVYLGEVTDKIAEKYELGETKGAYVSAVSPGSAAAEAGLMRGDVIVAVDGSPIANTGALSDVIRQHSPGDVIDVTVVRNGRRQDLSVELGERKRAIVKRIIPKIRALKNVHPNIHITGDKNGVFSVLVGNRYQLGLSYQELNKGLGEYFDRPDGGGLLITDVQEESAAAKAGLKPGDVIIGIDGNNIVDGGDLINALRAKDDDEAETRTFQVEIIRRGAPMTLSLEAKRAQGYNYFYKSNSEDLKKRSQELREHLKNFKGHAFIAPEMFEGELMVIPEAELLEEQVEMMAPEIELMLQDMEFMVPDLEMMIPELEMLLPDFGEDFIDLEDFDGTDVTLMVKPDGSVIFNGKKFDSVEEFKKHIEATKPDHEPKKAPKNIKAI